MVVNDQKLKGFIIDALDKLANDAADKTAVWVLVDGVGILGYIAKGDSEVKNYLQLEGAEISTPGGQAVSMASARIDLNAVTAWGVPPAPTVPSAFVVNVHEAKPATGRRRGSRPM